MKIIIAITLGLLSTHAPASVEVVETTLDEQKEKMVKETDVQFNLALTKGAFFSENNTFETVDSKEISLDFFKRYGKIFQLNIYGNHKYGNALNTDEFLVGGVYNFSSKNSLLSSFYVGFRAGVITGNSTAISHLKSKESGRKYKFAHQIFLGQRFNLYKKISWNPHGIFKYNRINKNMSEFQFLPVAMTVAF